MVGQPAAENDVDTAVTRQHLLGLNSIMNAQIQIMQKCVRFDTPR